MYDCYLIGIPYITSVYPNAALALLKGVAEERDYSVKSRCVAWEVARHFNNDTKNLEFCNPVLNNLPYSFDQIRSSGIGNMLYSVAKEAMQSRNIALNCFSYYNTVGCLYILEILKRNNYTGRVLVGGKGIKTLVKFMKEFDGREDAIAHDIFLQYSNVDICYGDGEEYFIDWLEGADEKDSITRNAPLDYVSNFDDFDDHTMLPVTGSRGCVRKCTFCDIPGQFEKYRWADGGTVADRMLFYHRKYGTKKFYFTDSLVNGNMRAFTSFLDTIIDYKHKYDIDFRWTGQYITRPIKQMPAEIYEKMSASGAEGLSTGIESGSNAVLKHMKKLFTIEDVHVQLENFRKNNLSYVLLMLPCYYTETEQDFIDTIDFLKHCQSYYADGTIVSVSGGEPLRFDGSGITPMEKMASDDCVVIDHTNPRLWYAGNNPGLDFKERTRRWLYVQKTIQDLMYNDSLNPNMNVIVQNYKEEMVNLYTSGYVKKFEQEAQELLATYNRGGYLNELRNLSVR